MNPVFKTPSFNLSGVIQLTENKIAGREIDDAAFLKSAKKIVTRPYSALLLSGGDHDSARYSLAAWDPFCLISAKGRAVRLQTSLGYENILDDPLAVLDGLFRFFQPDFPLEAPPFMGGAAGYLAYELKNLIERLPQTAQDDLNLPDLFFFFPGKILIHDRREKTLRSIGLACEGQVGQTVPPPSAPDRSVGCGEPLITGELESNFTHEDYLDAVGKTRNYIKAGDIYQGCLTQRFSTSFKGDPLTLLEGLFTRNPAPFYAFINAGDHQIISSSMERFLFRHGSYVETRPIKGTRPRGQDPEEDQRLKEELEASVKDNAELSMIVDLLRNDLGRVCRPRTVSVTEHRRIEAYQNVWHSVSIVSGELSPAVTHGDLIRAAFPGGSITGCPKIRAMEILDELEPNVRHVYTGSIGYLGWHENLDLSIAIRTAIRSKDKLYFGVGGGVVFDSEEEDEYQETLHKGRTFFEVIQSAGKGSEVREKIARK